MTLILVTGAGGCMGGIVFKHLNQNYEVYGLDIHQGYSAWHEQENERPENRFEISSDKYIHADITNKKAIDEVFDKYQFDIVFHFAALLESEQSVFHFAALLESEQSIEEIHKVNEVGAKNVLEAAARHGVFKIIFTNSIMVCFGYFESIEPYCLIKENYQRSKNHDNSPSFIKQITVTDEVKLPDENENDKAYSQSKINVEQYAKELVTQYEQLSVYCARLLWLTPNNTLKPSWENILHLSHEDLVQFVDCVMRTENCEKFVTCFVGSITTKSSPIDFSNPFGFKPTSYLKQTVLGPCLDGEPLTQKLSEDTEEIKTNYPTAVLSNR